MKNIISIDQGTSSTKCIIFNEEGKVISKSQQEFRQIYPKEGWVEHDPEEIKKSVVITMNQAVSKAGLTWSDITTIGITNQRETIVAWNKIKDQILHNAIVWQCRRTTPIVEELINLGYKDLFHKKTGLILDAYFSGTKIKWLIDNNNKIDPTHDGLAFGTIDSWIIYFLTGQHVTDASNASRTLLYNLKTKNWDPELCDILNIPIETLPNILPNCDEPFGIYNREGHEIPIYGVLGDQQAALFGQAGFADGSVKTTYGTGNFILQNTGSSINYSKNGLLTTVGWEIKNEISYAMEGSVFVTGAALQWLRDNLELFSTYDEIDKIANQVENAGETIFVPALAGLGAPYWDSTARGSIFGISRATSKSHLIHATLDSIAYQTEEVISLMEKETNKLIPDIRVDGGITQSKLLLQKQADISNKSVVRPQNIETTALGAAMIAGYKLIWDSFTDLNNINPAELTVNPNPNTDYIKNQKLQWKKAVSRTRGWL